jgi:hypothetical protein
MRTKIRPDTIFLRPDKSLTEAGYQHKAGEKFPFGIFAVTSCHPAPETELLINKPSRLFEMEIDHVQH